MKSVKLCLLAALFFAGAILQPCLAQDIVQVSVQQKDRRLQVEMSYDRVTQLNRPSLPNDFLRYQKQKVYIEITNTTQDTLNIQVNYGAQRYCGDFYDAGIGAPNGGDYFKPGQTLSKYFDASRSDLGQKDCIPTKLGNGEHSYITRVDYSIVRIFNLSEERRKRDAATAARLAEARKASAQFQAAQDARLSQNSFTPNTSAASSSTTRSSTSTSSSSGSARSSSNTTSSSGGNSNIVNGIDRSKLPALAMDAAGNHYQKDANNNYTKITAQQYQALKQEQATQRQAAATQAAAPAAPVYTPPPAPTMSKSQRNAEIASAVINAATPLLQQMAADRQARLEAEQAREEARQQREEEARIRKQNLVSGRQTLLANHPDGKVPLSSQTIAANELYYFGYTYDMGSISADWSKASVSNVFVVPRFGDGTWPFTKNIKSALATANKGAAVTLSGYYLTLAEAESKLSEFLSTCAEYNVSVSRFTYNTKKESSGGEFWGTGTPPAETAGATTPQKPAAGDFWADPSTTKPAVTADPTDAPGAKPTAKPADDFWGEPASAKPTAKPAITAAPDDWAEPAAPKKVVKPAIKPTTKPAPSGQKPKLDEWGDPIK